MHEPATIPPVVQSPPPSGRRRAGRGTRLGWNALVLVSAFALLSAKSEKRAPAAEVAAPPNDGAITLSREDGERFGVRLEPVRQIDLHPGVEVTGTVRFAPQYSAVVGTRSAGVVRSVKHFHGDQVAVGDVLAVVESAELGALEAEVGVLRARTRAAKLAAARAERLIEGGLSTERALEKSEVLTAEFGSRLVAAERGVSALGGGSGRGYYAIVASKAGTVIAQRVSVGQAVGGAQVAFEIADPEHLWIELSVEEKDAAGIRESDPVDVSHAGSAGRGLTGRVAFVGTAVNRTTMMVPVRVAVDGPTRELRAGSSVMARLHPSGRTVEGALVAPRSAVVVVDGRTLVFQVLPGDRLVPTEVELGDAQGDTRRIVSGIAAGSVVVTEGAAALRQRIYR